MLTKEKMAEFNHEWADLAIYLIITKCHDRQIELGRELEEDERIVIVNEVGAHCDNVKQGILLGVLTEEQKTEILRIMVKCKSDLHWREVMAANAKNN